MVTKLGFGEVISHQWENVCQVQSGLVWPVVLIIIPRNVDEKAPQEKKV